MKQALYLVLAMPLLFGCAPTFQQIKGAEHHGSGAELATHLSQSPHVYMREEAALAMGSLSPEKRSAKAYDALIAALRKENENPHVKAAAGLSLRRWGAEESVPDLIDAALSTADPEARYWLAYALHGFDNPDARSALESLRDDPDFLLSTSVREWTREGK